MENKLKLNIDYYLDEFGKMIFTEQYHLNRGTCCGSGCKHCPYINLDPDTPLEYTTHWSDQTFIDCEDEEDNEFE